MIRIRPLLKRWYYTYWPPAAGALRYFGSRIYFPQKSHLFERVCEEGVYEERNVRSVCALLQAGTWYFDIGANIGLMAAPVLRDFPDVKVVSFEPSPAALAYLRRSVEASPFRERWKLVEKALGATSGLKNFFSSNDANSAYDSLADTQRTSAPSTQISVLCSTLDEEWKGFGRPAVSVIKIDVEGAELHVLEGAAECLSVNRPAILIEWNAENLKAHGIAVDAILYWARKHQYLLHSADTGAPVATKKALLWQAAFTENFILFPAETDYGADTRAED
ncbi:MAG TPA: FkbM family methyltransferase [Chthoniobacter sp.]|nr:FkbM family methyltransferase [Chthoniobacter sp.]